jgi:hypothetical protein
MQNWPKEAEQTDYRLYFRRQPARTGGARAKALQRRRKPEYPAASVLRYL